MNASGWNSLEDLVVVAAHAVCVGPDFTHPEDENNWVLQPFQQGEAHFYVEHIRAGVELTAASSSSLLVLSGGQTRWEAGPRSEAQGYWNVASGLGWWSQPDVADRTTTEEFARDSFENLLFSICRFYECTGEYPRRIAVVSWQFKEARFDLHRQALRIPSASFKFHGVADPVDLEGAKRGEARALQAFADDPYGTHGVLDDKRVERNPFCRYHPYASSCPELNGVLRHRGPECHTGSLPWLLG